MAEYPNPSDRLVTIFGGSGFVGRYIVRAFARRGWRVRAAMRRPDLAGFLQPLGGVGQIQAVQANLRYPESVVAAAEGAEIVINAAGVKRETGRQSYEAVHAFGSDEIARAARAVGARALVQISGIGADAASGNPYIASKGRAEDAVRAAFPEAIILRPSVVFGPEDDFLNRFANLARFLPVLPLFGGGATRLQPVFVGDIALAATSAIDGVAQGGKIYELGGPEVLTLRETVELVLRIVERRRGLVGLPFPVSRFLAGSTEFASAPDARPVPCGADDDARSGRIASQRQCRLRRGDRGGAHARGAGRGAARRRGDRAGLSLPFPQNGPVRAQPFRLSRAALSGGILSEVRRRRPLQGGPADARVLDWRPNLGLRGVGAAPARVRG